MSTTTLLVLATLVYAAFGIFASQAGGRIDAKLSAGILNGIGAILPLAIWQIQRIARGGLMASRPSGLVFSLLAGFAVGVFSILLVTIYGRGGELSFVFPVIYGGAIALTAVLGWTALGDAFTWTRLGGVAVIVLGIGLLALPTR
jgi:multidrug transporter EmrE-like cation transporter